MIVADATLLVHLVIGSEARVAATAVRWRDPVWVAPPLWSSEVRSALLKYVRVGLLSEVQAVEASRLAARAVTDVLAVEHEEVFRAATVFNLSVYDAEYVALAERLRVPLVTSDQRLVGAVGRAVTPGAFASAV